MSTGEGFWAFSNRVYGAEDVPPACIALQNDYGLDVNFLLYCCWLGAQNRLLDAAALTRALAFAGPWSEHVVRPLRHARTWMKHDSDAREQLPSEMYTELRESIKAIELQAERLEQLALEAMTDQTVPAPAGAHTAARCASINLDVYVEKTGNTPDADMRAHLETLIDRSTNTDRARAAQSLATGSKSGGQSTDD